MTNLLFLSTLYIACKKICMQISDKDPFQREIFAFVEESKPGNARTLVCISYADIFV